MTQKQKFAASALFGVVIHILSPGLAIAETCRLTALDTVAGLGTQVSLAGCLVNTAYSIDLRGPSGTPYSQTVSTDASGNATTLIPSRVTATAGQYNVDAGSASAQFTVIADRADDGHSAISASPSSVQPNGTVTVTAVLRDRYDNPVSGRPIALISNRTSDDITAQFAQTDDDGRFLWSVKPVEPGTMTLVTYDVVSGRQMKLSASVAVGSVSSSYSTAPRYTAALTGFEQGGDITADVAAGIIDHFEISLPAGTIEVKANELFSLTVRAMREDVLVRSYIGTLVVDSSDPDAELPKKGEDQALPKSGRIDMRNVDQGERRVPLSFVLRRGGTQTITVYDKQDPNIKGTFTVNVVSSTAAGSDKIVILSPKDRTHVKGETVMLQGRAPSLINLRVKGGREEVIGETDSEGVFRIAVPLHSEDKEVTLFVESENGTYDSDPLHVIIDNEPPKVGTVGINPAEGRTEEPAFMTILSEDDTASIAVTIEGKTVNLTGSGASGVFSGEITAPPLPNTYDVAIKAIDTVGNESNVIAKWVVKPRTVPVVQSVKAEVQGAGIKLTWNPITTMPVTQYKIYIAKDADPKNFIYGIGTGEPVTSAIIKDLPLGVAYRFSLTAINTEGEESSEKSTPVVASPLGFALKATPGEDSVMLEWKPIASLPLSHYMLEFGTQSGVYPEKRTVNGQAVSYIVGDLIKGVSYEFKLTPVTVTGKVMSDLAALTRGTPGGSGFTAKPSDAAPDGMFDNLHPGADYNPPKQINDVPRNVGTGLSSVVLGFLAMGAVVVGLLYRGHKREQRLTQEFMELMRGRYQA